jgi:hypothetical protein
MQVPGAPASQSCTVLALCWLAQHTKALLPMPAQAHTLPPGGRQPDRPPARPPARPTRRRRSWWTPATGGANVPALNDLLAPFGAALGDVMLQGGLKVAAWDLQASYGANVARFPAGG